MAGAPGRLFVLDPPKWPAERPAPPDSGACSAPQASPLAWHLLLTPLPRNAAHRCVCAAVPPAAARPRARGRPMHLRPCLACVTRHMRALLSACACQRIQSTAQAARGVPARSCVALACLSTGRSLLSRRRAHARALWAAHSFAVLLLLRLWPLLGAIPSVLSRPRPPDGHAADAQATCLPRVLCRVSLRPRRGAVLAGPASRRCLACPSTS